MPYAGFWVQLSPDDQAELQIQQEMIVEEVALPPVSLSPQSGRDDT